MADRDREDAIRVALSHVGVPWTSEKTRALIRQMPEKRRRARLRLALAGSTLIAAVAGAAVIARPPAPDSNTTAEVPRQAGPVRILAPAGGGAILAPAAPPILTAQPVASRQDLVWTSQIGQEDVRLVVSSDVTKVRGVLVLAASAPSGQEELWRETARNLSFAHLQLSSRAFVGGQRSQRLADALRRALRDIAVHSGHEELARVPLLFVRPSRSGGWSTDLAARLRHRTLASATVAPWIPRGLEQVNVPSLFVLPSLAPTQREPLDAAFRDGRRQRAPWAMVSAPSSLIDLDRAVVLLLPWAEAIVAMRMPAGAEAPIHVTADADARTSWLPTPSLADTSTAFLSADPDTSLELRTPAGAAAGAPWMVVDVDDAVAVTLRATDPAVERVTFLEGDRVLAEVGAPFLATLSGLLPGAHAVHAVARSADGRVRTVAPVLIVVRRP